MSKITTNKTENLPAKQGQSFALAQVDETKYVLNPDIQKALDESDREGYEEPSGTIPIVQIRQKEFKDDKGNLIGTSGNFKIYDRVSDSANRFIPDVSGKIGLDITIIKDQPGQVYFQDNKPICRSIDGRHGIGEPGGLCATCTLKRYGVNQIKIKPGETNKLCKAQMNLLVWDHNLKDFYVLRFGPSGLSPYNDFKAQLKRDFSKMKLDTLHIWKLRVTTKYEFDCDFPYYIPVFEISEQVDYDLYMKLKQARQEFANAFSATVDVHDNDEDQHTGGSVSKPPNSADAGGELPPDVEPVNSRDEYCEGGLPF